MNWHLWLERLRVWTGRETARVLKRLASEREEERIEAARALRTLPVWGRHIARLVAALDDPSPFVRWEVAETLVDIGPQKALRPVLKRAQEEGSVAGTAAAVRVLGFLGDQAALETIVSRAEHPDPEVRVAVAEALTHFPDLARSRETLVLLLEDKHPVVRRAAAWALRRTNDKQARAVLSAYALKESEPWLRQVMQGADEA